MNSSSKWMSRAHALIPLTEQERQVGDLLLQLGLTLAEAPHVEFATLAKVVGEILVHADGVAYSIEDLQSAIYVLGGAS